MGSDFHDLVTMEEAAKMLGRTRRSITTYVKSGVLKREVHAKKAYVRRAEVEQLQLDLGSGFQPLNRKTFYHLSAHVQKLEMDVAVLKRMNGLYDSPLRPSRVEAEGLHTAAVKALQAGVWQVDEIVQWADLFDRMDDVFFEVLSHHSSIPDSWRPFYELCLSLMRQLSQAEEFKTTLGYQALHDRLSVGLSQMRKVILVWVEAGHSEKSDRARAMMDGSTQAILNRLTAKA